MKPEHVIVIGAGMVGLSTAWHLQEDGVRVTMVDKPVLPAVRRGAMRAGSRRH